MKTLIVVAHPNLTKSTVNKRWVDELKKYPDLYTVHVLSEAYPDGNIDVKAEQELIEAHENLVLQFPIFWFNCSALMKKWLDDVLLHGWAYGSGDGNKMRGRKVALAVTAGSELQKYQEAGKYGHTLAQLLAPFEVTFIYTESDYRSFFALYGANNPVEDLIEKSASDYINFLKQI